LQRNRGDSTKQAHRSGLFQVGRKKEAQSVLHEELP
jgi:hypothetical protein